MTSGVEAVEVCRTRACDAPQRVPVGADGRATLGADLETGTWFWRTAASVGSTAGPLWSIKIRKSPGRSSRVHGYDANGDGFDDVSIGAALLLGAGAFGGAGFAPVPYPPFDATPGGRPSPSKDWATPALRPLGDVDGDGFDDAALDRRVVRGGPTGIRPSDQWFECPPAGCGRPIGDIDGDGYADLAREGELQLGSPSGFRLLPSSVLAESALVEGASDLDGDGLGDLFMLSADHLRLSVLRGGAHGITPGASVGIRAPEDAAFELAVGDIDGDGTADAIVLITEPVATAPGQIRATVIVRSTPRGGDIALGKERRLGWTAKSGVEGVPPSAKLGIADVDGDGVDDVIVFIGGPFVGRAMVIRGSTGALRLEPRSVGLRAEDDSGGVGFRSVGDVNGDGRDDVIIVGQPSVGGGQTIDLHLGGKAGFQPKPLAHYLLGVNSRVPTRDEPDPDSPTGGARQ